MIYAVAGFCVYRLRDREPEADRPFRMRGAKALAAIGIVLFTILAVAAGVSVKDRINPWPLVIILVCGGLAASYVLIWLPRVRAAEEARTAARPTRRPRRPVPSEGPAPG